MKIFYGKMRKKLCAFILVISIFVSAVYQNEAFAENNTVDAAAQNDSLQAQTLEIKVEGHILNGKHEYGEKELADYKDGILMTLDEDTSVLGEEEFIGDKYENETSLYGNLLTVEAGECILTKSIVAENDINFKSQTISTKEEDSAVLYSKAGNIELQGDNIQFTGILYAPEATVVLSAKRIQFHGALVAKNIVIESDELELNGYSDSDMGKLEWMREAKINSNYTILDEDNRKLIFHMENYDEAEIYVRQENSPQFELLATTAEDTYEINYDEIQGISEYRTVAKRFGETSNSSIFTYFNNNGEIEETVLDSDGDRIADGYEIWDLGTDPYSADTDGDGFTDGYEAYVLYTNPLEFTEDGDSDGDGLFDKSEMELGTNPHLPDSDFDGLIDSADPEPMLTDVESGQVSNYEVETKIGVFDVCVRYYDENGAAFETVYDYTDGHSVFLNSEGKETKRFYNQNGDETANIQKADGEYIVNTTSYDENGNAISVNYNGMRYDYGYDENGNIIKTVAGDRVLEESSYDGEQLTEVVYGNGDSQKMEYDSEGNLVKVLKNDTVAYEWEYEENRPLSYHDYLEDKTYTYSYDENDYLSQIQCSDGFTVEYADDGEHQEITYSYGDESIHKATNILEDNEDSLKVEVINGEDTYVAQLENDTLTSHFVTSEDVTVAESEKEITEEQRVEAEKNSEETIEYQYDENDNIIEVKTDGVVTAAYEYDGFGQLVREDSLENGTTVINEYDAGGNILSATEYSLDMEADTDTLTGGSTAAYEYGDEEWGDLLTAYNGAEITYDEIGNPVQYYNGMAFEWEGKELTSVQSDGKTTTYSYDGDGLRTRKSTDSGQTDYFWENGNLIGESRNGNVIWYMYDAGNAIAGFQYDGNSYYFNKNLQGDVLSIADSNGTVLVEYGYDAWGKTQIVSGDEELGNLNPIKYRGYYYDAETGFYYLQNRYYDAETGRFLNADCQLDFEAGNAEGNLFTYAGNNSVMRVDPTGRESAVITIITIVVVLVLVSYLSASFIPTWRKNCQKLADAMSRELAKISSVLTYYRSLANALWADYSQSFARAKKTYTGNELHHIVAKGAYRAAEARKVLNSVGIGTESSYNLVRLKKGLHRRLHTNMYYRIANEMVIKTYNMSGKKYKKTRNVKGVLEILKETLKGLNRMAPF